MCKKFQHPNSNINRAAAQDERCFCYAAVKTIALVQNLPYLEEL